MTGNQWQRSGKCSSSEAHGESSSKALAQHYLVTCRKQCCESPSTCIRLCKRLTAKHQPRTHQLQNSTL